MHFKTLSFFFGATVSVVLSVSLSSAALAVVVPGAADVGRIKPEEKMGIPDHSRDQEIIVPSVMPSAPIPEAAKSIHFTLKAVHVEGATAFTPEQLADLYAVYIDKDVTLDKAWVIAGGITERYRNAGYFLSRAYVPQQSIKDGILTIRVIEGYVGKVELPEEVRGHSVIQEYIERLVDQKPLAADTLERFLLQLNDLPGYSFRAVLSKLEDNGEEEPAVKLTLVPAATEGRGSIGFDNFSSRYLGPNELSAAYSTSLLPLQQTSVSGLTSVPFDTLHYGTLDHIWAMAPDMTLEVNGGVTKAYPGYTLESDDINSEAVSESISINYQWIRQRLENLALKFTLDRRDIRSDILDVPLTRDHIRAIRAGGTYNISDHWQGYDVVSATLSRGIAGFGASQKGDLNVSRGNASPGFTKAEFSLSRLQGITQDWLVFAAAAGQLASGTLYSSEQFGYGGQAFGRAYDASDITGDRGINSSLELRYGGWGAMQPLSMQPYSFCDFGTVWNDAVGQPKRQSGASAGFGVRIATIWHQSGNLGVAWPLTRDISAPTYNSGKSGPRIVLQFVQEF